MSNTYDQLSIAVFYIKPSSGVRSNAESVTVSVTVSVTKSVTERVMPVGEWVSSRIFKLVHANNLVYNTCWEDPRLDRVALQLGPADTVLVITSAGCNALDYLLAGAGHVHAVDVNPRQNALLELKIAAIRQLEYEPFFALFGRGWLADAPRVYREQLRRVLSPWARRYWDRRIRFFANPRRSFYFRGSSGMFARLINGYVDHVGRLRAPVERLLNAATIEEQRQIYFDELREPFWSWMIRFLINRDATLALVGVPPAQRRQIERQYPGGILQFVQDGVESVFTRLPIQDNYFWRVYATGSYTPGCCPEYIKEESFLRLKAGLVDRIRIHTASVLGFLETAPAAISRFVLLDHMDWLADHSLPLLEREWQAIVERAAPGARAIWRSGGLRTDYLDAIQVRRAGSVWQLNELLTHHDQLARELHAQDRVHTYGSFYVADIAT